MMRKYATRMGAATGKVDEAQQKSASKAPLRSRSRHLQPSDYSSRRSLRLVRVG